jgi:hypothetical protein
VSFEKDSPRESNGMAPAPQGRAVHVIQIPHDEAAQEDGQAEGNHGPHGLENNDITVIAAAYLGDGAAAVAVETGEAPELALLLAPLGAQAKLHDVDGADEDDGGEDGVHDLVEDGVAEVVVVAGDEEGEGEQGGGEEEGVGQGAAAGEGGVEHDAGGVYHGELVDELHGVWVCTSDRFGVVVVVVVGGWIGNGDDQSDDEHLSVEWKRKLPQPTIR